MLYWLLLICGLILIYYKLYKPHQYWKEKDIAHKTPLPIVGNMFPTVFQLKSMTELIQGLYNSEKSRYFGLYQFMGPVLLIKDIDLIKQIGIKDFDSFPDHKNFIPEEVEPIFTKNLVALKGQKWKDMRSTLSPAFTSSKMRAMFVLISECAEQFTQHFKEKVNSETPLTVEMKDIYTRYTNDVIATCAFGIKCDSLKNRENEFYLSGKAASNFAGIKNFIFLGYTLAPSLMKTLKIKIFSEKLYKFFSTLIITTIKTREEQGIFRPDMIHLLMEAQKGRLKHEEPNKNEGNIDGFATVEESDIGKEVLDSKPGKILTQLLSNEDIIAQALIFFLAGFDTASTLLSMMSYELAINPDVQQKLHNEIDTTLKECNGKITYEALLRMKYLDMVVSESLRKWPPAAVTDRVCLKPYTIYPSEPNEKLFTVENGIMVWIPIYAIHRDPQYYPDPEKFDPERFSDENKSNIKPFTYIPFGIGPRNCIGSRFALLEAKIIFFHLLSAFELVVVEKTQIPFKLSRKQFTIAAQNGNWLGLKLRQ